MIQVNFFVATTYLVSIACIAYVAFRLGIRFRAEPSTHQEPGTDLAPRRPEREGASLQSAPTSATIDSSDQPLARIDNPITRLTFRESMDVERFATASIESSTAGINAFLASRAADGIVVTVHSVRLVQQGTEMIVSATAHGQELFKQGLVTHMRAADGSRRPLLVFKDTRRIAAQLKELPVSAITSKLASVTSIAVGGAHLVAGADIAKRLGQVERKLDFLLAARRIDQWAQLERIYIAARELASGELIHDHQLEMWRLRGELRELRSAWRRELQLRLERIEDPASASWFKRHVTKQSTVDKHVAGQISAGEAEVALIEYSMRLEYLLAVGSNTIDAFGLSQASELEQLSELADDLRKKANYIQGEDHDKSVEPMVRAITAIVEAHRALLPVEGHVLGSPRDQLTLARQEIVHAIAAKTEGDHALLHTQKTQPANGDDERAEVDQGAHS